MQQIIHHRDEIPARAGCSYLQIAAVNKDIEAYFLTSWWSIPCSTTRFKSNQRCTYVYRKDFSLISARACLPGVNVITLLSHMTLKSIPEHYHITNCNAFVCLYIKTPKRVSFNAGFCNVLRIFQFCYYFCRLLQKRKQIVLPTFRQSPINAF